MVELRDSTGPALEPLLTLPPPLAPQQIDDLLAGGFTQEDEDAVLQELDEIIKVGPQQHQGRWADPPGPAPNSVVHIMSNMSGHIPAPRHQRLRLQSLFLSWLS